MLASSIIVFREILEIALILGVIGAATRGLAGRGKWIAFGIMGALAGSGLVAYFANEISEAAEGLGQEVFNAIILFAATALIGWTVIWMSTHAKQLSAHLKNVGKKIADGSLPMYSLAVVVAITGLREGSEIILFTHGILASGTPGYEVFIGSMGGLVGGTIIGAMLYLGLLQISPKYIFSVTSWLLIFLAAGMAANGAKYLVAADILTFWTSAAWNSGNIISQDGFIGQVLHALFGYSERPMGIQLAFYVATAALLFVATNIKQKRHKPAISSSGASA